MSPDAGVDHGGQLADRQVELLLKEIAVHSDRISEIIDLMTELPPTDGRGWEDCERVLDGLAEGGSEADDACPDRAAPGAAAACTDRLRPPPLRR